MKKIIVLSLVLAFSLFAQDKQDFSPKFSGYVKAWHQTDLGAGQGAFSVKQARLSINGYVNEYAGYKFQVDFTRLGKLTTTTTTVNGVKVVNSASATFSDILLDAAATLSPIKNLEITAGQFKVPFSTDNLKSDQNHEFANRPMITSVSPNIRDIGVTVGYKVKGDINAEVIAGSFNGSGFNKTENDKSMDYSLRAVVNPVKDLNVFANYYGGKVGGFDQSFTGFGADYKYNDLLFGGEYASKNLSTIVNDVTGNSYFVFANYNIATNGTVIKDIIPAVRFEKFDPNTNTNNNEINRLTLGLTFNFAKISFAHFRINYEKFDYKDGTTNPDKLVFELQTRF